MLITIDTSQLLGAIGRDMFYFRLGAIVMTGLGTDTTACTCFQGSFERLVKLCLKSFQGEFNGFSHASLTSPLLGMEYRAEIPHVAQRISRRTSARRRNTDSGGSFQTGHKQR